MSDRPLWERTRPLGRSRKTGAASTDPVRRPTTTRVRGRTRGRPTRGAAPPPPQQRRRRRRINWTRITASVLCLALLAGTAWLAAGPWLRIRAVTYAGADWTGRDALDAVTDPMHGRSLLLVDTRATAEALGTLPGVQAANVDISPFGDVRVSLVEADAVARWRTDAAQLLVAEDGTVVGVLALDATAGAALAALPVVEDRREGSHDLSVGDQLATDEVTAALLVSGLTPAQLGSQAAVLTVAFDETFGFVVTAPQAGWQAAFGFYGVDPNDTPDVMRARLQSQASGVRTLFASHPEASLAWIDARNPGRVYFRARG